MTFEELEKGDGFASRLVSGVLSVGGTVEDCCVILAGRYEKTVRRLIELEGIEAITEQEKEFELFAVGMIGVGKDFEHEFQTELNEDYAKAVAEETEQKGCGK